MKNEVSALMDGEIESENVSRIVEMLKNNNELKNHWETYHLIGDALRQPSHLSLDLSSSVAAKLQNEPVVFSPNLSNSLKKQKRKVAMLALAASIVLGVSTLIGVNQYLQEPKQQTLVENKKQENKQQAVPMTVSTQLQSIRSYPLVFEPNDYSFLHGGIQPVHATSHRRTSNIQYIEDRKNEMAE